MNTTAGTDEYADQVEFVSPSALKSENASLKLTIQKMTNTINELELEVKYLRAQGRRVDKPSDLVNFWDEENKRVTFYDDTFNKMPPERIVSIWKTNASIPPTKNPKKKLP